MYRVESLCTSAETLATAFTLTLLTKFRHRKIASFYRVLSSIIKLLCVVTRIPEYHKS